MLKKVPFVLFLAFLFLSGYFIRFQLFPNHSPSPHGHLIFTEDPISAQKIDRYFEVFHSKKANRVYDCAHNFWARDDRYIYIDLVCGHFIRREADVIETEYGYRAPTRVEFDSANQIIDFEQPGDGTDYWKHYNWLFPKKVQEVDRSLKSTDPWKNIHLKTLK